MAYKDIELHIEFTFYVHKPTLLSASSFFQKNIYRMKNFLLSMFLFCLSIQTGIAQKIQVGLHSGLGKAQLSNFQETQKDQLGADWVISRTEGLDLTWYLGRRLGIGIEGNYTSKGNVRYGTTTRVFYYHLPLFLKHEFYVSESENLNLFAKLGGYFARTHEQTTQYSLSQIYLLEYSMVSEFDYGACFGLGAGLKLDDNIQVSMELRGERGLANVFALVTRDTQKPIGNISGWATLGLSYIFPSPYQK